ncbi:hypothetical protein PV367_01780 [Streptomyces europaeiscabiei]|uniref:Uncharacterized protein n=1 Tax=Streptomyces europaeiscabiei TaxID=146819 RepID=A0AAJ2PJY4_9ACTN|nr:hypothetical protein [Streptomyces europaeiscabiei]MDX3128558.1 hypothetical protein [Streptomyces europaeiscabiei]
MTDNLVSFAAVLYAPSDDPLEKQPDLALRWPAVGNAFGAPGAFGATRFPGHRPQRSGPIRRPIQTESPAFALRHTGDGRGRVLLHRVDSEPVGTEADFAALEIWLSDSTDAQERKASMTSPESTSAV